MGLQGWSETPDAHKNGWHAGQTGGSELSTIADRTTLLVLNHQVDRMTSAGYAGSQSCQGAAEDVGIIHDQEGKYPSGTFFEVR